MRMVHFKRLLALLCLALTCFAITVIPLHDVAGNGTIQQFSSTITGQVAVWVEVVCTGTGTLRLGSTTVAPASNIGVPCAAGGTQFYPAVSSGNGTFLKYDLSTLLFLAPAGTTVSITYATQ